MILSSAMAQTTIVPTLTTNEATVITHYSLFTGGVITDNGGGGITSKGVCWSSTRQMPLITDSKITSNSSGNDFQLYVNCLAPNTTYYIRAYATNKAGTAYGNTITITTLSEANNTVSDIEGNIYKTIKIGSQTWFAENLRTSHYNNGDVIMTTDKEISEENKPQYQWPANGDESLVEKYGRLYTWYVVTDKRNVCPCGWHVPTQEDWAELIEYLGGDVEQIGANLKESGTKNWNAPNKGATNSSGFTALPAGIRDYTEGFAWFGKQSQIWTSTNNDEDDAIYFNLNHLNSEILEDTYNKKAGYSVRCIKD
ncbi:MAG: hypothetical protein Fur0028_02420 [Bacteroidales bacterium]